jgi:hypothetical protein
LAVGLFVLAGLVGLASASAVAASASEYERSLLRTTPCNSREHWALGARVAIGAERRSLARPPVARSPVAPARL